MKPDPHRNQIRVFLVKRVFSFGILITVAFLLLISLALSTVIAAISTRADDAVRHSARGAPDRDGDRELPRHRAACSP